MNKFFLLSIVLLSLLSCDFNDDLKYSCDEVTNQWVRDNLNQIHKMSRNDWSKVSNSMKRPIYRAFTPDQKIAFWLQRIAEIQELGWSQNEKEHIQKVSDFINTHNEFFFVKTLNDEQLDELEMFFYRWIQESIDRFGWSERVAKSIVATGYRLKNKDGEIDMSDSGSSMVMSSSAEPDCNCTDFVDFCFFAKCEPGGCDTGLGCGVLWLQDCIGLCMGV